MVSNGPRSLVRFGHQTEIERHFEILKFEVSPYSGMASCIADLARNSRHCEPSNERYLTNWYTDDALRTAEF